MSDIQIVVQAEVVAVIEGKLYPLGSYYATEEAEARLKSMIEDGSIDQTDGIYIDTVIKSRKYYRQDNKTLINLEGM